MPSPTAADLADLSRKYRTLGGLRRAHASDATDEDRAALRAIATEFPGALRELDTLPLDEIDRRAEALARCSEGGATEDWMAWMHAYHALMRAALLAKIRIGRARRVSDETTARIALDAAKISGMALDERFVRAIAAPPDGRLSVVVFDRLGQLFGVAPAAIWDALFPPRRPGRY